MFKRIGTKYLTYIQFLVIIILIYRSYRLDFSVFETTGNRKNVAGTVQNHSSTFQPKSLPERFLSSTEVNVSMKKPPNVDVLEKSSGDIYRRRLDHARERCESYVGSEFWKKLIPHGQVWSYGGMGGIHFCIVPKVGCTYWKRIFRFLNKDYPKKANVTRSSDIDRYFVHYGNLANTNVTSMANRLYMHLFSGSKMFMFTRDPYSRLWSAYIDKFLLPDFWRSFASDAMRRTRRKATNADIKCSKTITFVEYLKYVIQTTNSANEHWTPIHKLCSPCHVQYDVIGKQETFSEDSKFILNRYGISHVYEESTSGSRVKEETSMLIEYNFGLEKSIRNDCFEKLEVASKLWKAFQYNGYIHKDTPFPEKSLNITAFNLNPKLEFSKLLDNVITDQRRRGINLKSQKREMMIEAYRKVPLGVLHGIQGIFRYDFELFSYEKEPKDIYLR